jgi:serine phosphatase RsbU (regulator of sigma subunit)
MKSFFYLVLLLSFNAFAQQAKVEVSLTSLNQDTLKVSQLLSLSKDYANKNLLKMNSYADTALRVSQDINYERGVVMSLNYIGQAKIKLAEYNEALTLTFNALDIAERLKYKECIGLSYNLIGYIYMHQNDLGKAGEYYNKALEIAQKIGNSSIASTAQNGLGNVFFAKRDNKQALESYSLALQVAIKEENKNQIAEVETNLGRVYLAQGMNSLAIDYFQKALKIARETSNLEAVADNCLILADYYFKKNLPNEALKYAQAGLAAAETLQSRFFKQKAWALMSEIYGFQKNYKKAYEYNQLSKILQDSILDKESKQGYMAITSQYEEQIRDKEITIKNLQLEQQKKDIQNQQRIIYIAVASSAIFIALAILAFVLYRRQKKANYRIKEQNKQITEQNEEINTKNEEINKQNSAIESKNNALERAYKEIEKKTENILASISYAKRIQTALLPDQEDIALTFPENFIYYKPKDVISGDFYYFMEVGHLRILAVADCTGHGVPGAFMSVLGVQSLNKIIQSGITSPDLILSELHNEIRQVLKQQVNEVRDGMDIVLCVIDTQKKTLTFAGAINPLYYIQTNGNGLPEFVEIKATKKPIGGFQRDEEARFFEKTVIDISKPTTFYLATDGYRDQFGGEHNKKFMARRFKELLYHIYDKPMYAQQKILDEVITKWLGKNEQIDDMLVIGIRV